MVTVEFEVIEKEKLTELRFPQNEVLQDPAAMAERQLQLERALSLGNLEHAKIRIYFEDDAGRKMVETTVWGVTDKRVILKQSLVIPINRIHHISI